MSGDAWGGAWGNCWGGTWGEDAAPDTAAPVIAGSGSFGRRNKRWPAQPPVSPGRPLRSRDFDDWLIPPDWE